MPGTCGRGTKGFSVADGFRDVNIEISNLFKGDVAKGYGYFGTSMAVDYCDAVGILPTNNYREGVFAGAPNINGQAIRDKILVRKRSCHGCVLGLIKEKDVGMELKFGDAKAMVELTRKTGLREGFGDLLALGSYRLAEKYGRPELSMTSKKMEITAYDPRGSKGMALTYATNPRGGDHTRGATVFPEIFGIPKKVKSKAIEGKA